MRIMHSIPFRCRSLSLPERERERERGSTTGENNKPRSCFQSRADTLVVCWRNRTDKQWKGRRAVASIPSIAVSTATLSASRSVAPRARPRSSTRAGPRDGRLASWRASRRAGPSARRPASGTEWRSALPPVSWRPSGRPWPRGTFPPRRPSRRDPSTGSRRAPKASRRRSGAFRRRRGTRSRGGSFGRAQGTPATATTTAIPVVAIPRKTSGPNSSEYGPGARSWRPSWGFPTTR
mmetsp:Transcript_17598/g.40173  ORF Transcript_17598/g.40173 Transcript_17598/m.40173 type:complete len:236 (-) Transcript_17598:2007-2714(-)